MGSSDHILIARSLSNTRRPTAQETLLPLVDGFLLQVAWPGFRTKGACTETLLLGLTSKLLQGPLLPRNPRETDRWVVAL